MIDLGKFTAEQLIALGLQSIVCEDTVECADCPLRVLTKCRCDYYAAENPEEVFKALNFNIDSFIKKQESLGPDSLEERYVNICNDYVETIQAMNYEHGRAEAYREILMKIFKGGEVDDKR